MLAGDFNDILSHHESLSSSPPNHRRMSAFNDFLSNCNLLDLGYSGPRFMWTNKRDNGLVMKSLDRALSKPQWKLLFNNAHVHHLPRNSFDHHPNLSAPLHPSFNRSAPNPSALKRCGSITHRSQPSFKIPGTLILTALPQLWMISHAAYNSRTHSFGNIFHKKK